MPELYIGLMSGTSLDGFDAVLVDLTENQPKLIESHYEKMDPALRKAILEICQPGYDEINRMSQLDITLGKAFANVVEHLLKKSHISASRILAIGSHGQTIRHYPDKAFTLQIGDPNIIAAETGITTIADFRRRDIAHGGQGAPLVPAFHESLFSDEKTNRIILNIGGISNITLLTANKQKNTVGFDTGPGNTLLDAWSEKHLQKPCDEKGLWASQGKVNNELLSNLLTDPFFKLPAPKSTGREYFNLGWLERYLQPGINTVDIQTTLVELTAKSIINAIHEYFPNGQILVCGGGVHNEYLMQRLQLLACPMYSVATTSLLGINPDWVEATAFAWLAKQTLNKKPSNLTSVTGAIKHTILGGVYYT